MHSWWHYLGIGAGDTAPVSPSAEADLSHPDPAVRQAAIRDCLLADATHATALAGLEALATADAADARLAALDLLAFLPPARQATLLRDCLHSLDPRLMKAASQATAHTSAPEVADLLLSLLEEKAVRKLAADALVAMGPAVLPSLETALQTNTDYPLLRRLALVCARLATPASRRVLVVLAQHANLTRRAAALHALSHFAAVAAEAPLFQHLMQKEMSLAQQLLHGMLEANTELRSCLKYELTKVEQRLFGLLLQIYDREPVLAAQHGLTKANQQHRNNALGVLDNLIPRPLYRGLQALLDVERLTKKVQTFDELLGPVPPEAILHIILQRGNEAFAPWTLSVALRQWQPTAATLPLLHRYLQAPNPLVRESAEDVLALLPARYPAIYEHWLRLYPAAATPIREPAPVQVPALDRLLLLKHTALFAETAENVLSSIVPIMKEVAFREGQQIFAKGDLGTSLFIVHEGAVGIYNEEQLLATFQRGDFFGELALLDAEPRSATAVAREAVVALRLDQEDFYDVMEECTEVLQNILRVLCQRLRLQNEKLKAQALPQSV